MTPIISEWEVLQELFLEQYKESPKYRGIIEAIAIEAQLLEDCRWELAQLLNVDLMEGPQLDLLGKIAKTPRQNAAGLMTDVEYRVAIKLALRTRSSGSPPEIIAAVKEITGATSVIYIPEYPAGFWVIPIGGNPAKLTQAYLDEISPAGVRGLLPCYLSLESPPSGNPEEAFLFEDGEWMLIEGPCIPPYSNYPDAIYGMIGDTTELMIGAASDVMTGAE